MADIFPGLKETNHSKALSALTGLMFQGPRSKVVLSLAAALLLALGGVGYLLFANHALRKQLTALEQDPTALVKAQNQQLLGQVGKLMILPTNEEPTVATVTDLAKLQGQPFFANAKLGDRVLIYVQAKKAILYRPNENRIIEVAPFFPSPPAP